MKGVDLYGRVRSAVQREGLSNREAARRFGIDPRTVAKMLRFSVPPGYKPARGDASSTGPALPSPTTASRFFIPNLPYWGYRWA